MKVNNVLSNNHMNKQINDDASYTIRMRHSIIYLCLLRDFYRLIFRSLSTSQFLRPLQKQPLKLTSLINLLEDPDGVTYLVYIFRPTRKTRHKYQKLLAVSTWKMGREDRSLASTPYVAWEPPIAIAQGMQQTPTSRAWFLMFKYTHKL